MSQLSKLIVGSALTLLAFSSALGCGGEGDGDIAEVRCERDDRQDSYAPGMTAEGAASLIEVRLVEAEPGPPAKGDNSWLVDVLELGSEDPVTGATLSVTPFMPDHGHGTPVQAEIAPTQSPGQFQIDRINLWMPGLWEVTVEADMGSDVDSAAFRFCIEG